jgi:hypothetical protein
MLCWGEGGQSILNHKENDVEVKVGTAAGGVEAAGLIHLVEPIESTVSVSFTDYLQRFPNTPIKGSFCLALGTGTKGLLATMAFRAVLC